MAAAQLSSLATALTLSTKQSLLHYFHHSAICQRRFSTVVCFLLEAALFWWPSCAKLGHLVVKLSYMKVLYTPVKHRLFKKCFHYNDVWEKCVEKASKTV